MTKYLIGMVGALAGMLVGGWLMLAPFALAYQPSGADWADPTYTDFWSGLVILVVSLIGLVAYALGLIGELRRRGIIEERIEVPRPQQAQIAGTPVVPTGGETPTGSGDNVEQILLPLVTAMLKDMQEDQRRREENYGGTPRSDLSTPKWRLDPERRAQQ
ncbi:MAG: hypothetical protein M3N18_07815 [Actinomycetota bacterium]|nr:hypothetical protein [Actinomycetota bacterium]